MMPDKTLPTSSTANNIQPFHVMKILGEARSLEAKGKDIIHLEVGEPDFPSLVEVHQAVCEAIDKGHTHYTPTMGLPTLREKLSDFYHHYYKAKVSPERIMLTPGSSSALQLLLTAVLNPGDKVMMPDPTYPCNRQFVELLHGEIISVPVDSRSQFQLNLELLQSYWHSDIKIVMVASPANPTGTMISQNELMKMAKFLSEQNVWFIVDEIYQGLVYDEPPSSILANTDLPDNVLVINSFSKFFGMTGWRLGWLVGQPCLMPVLDKLGQNLFLSAPTPSQYGALRVLDKDVLKKLETRRDIFATRRDTLYQEMINAGLQVPTKPQGAFYLYWDVSELTDDSETFAQELLYQTGVTVTPGIDFGDHKAKQFIRLAYTAEKNKLKAAIQRVSQYLLSRDHRR